MTPPNLARPVAVLVGLLIAAVSLAQQAFSPDRTAGAGPRSPSPSQIMETTNFGPAGLTYLRFNGLEFYPYTSGSGYSSSGNRRWPLIAGYGMDAALRVPSGAIIDYLEFDFCDNNPTFEIELTIRECNLTGSACSAIQTVSSTGSPGCATASMNGINYVVDNGTHALGLESVVDAGDGSLSIVSAVVGYRLQVSPAPGIATFPVDVPTSHPFFQYVEALAAAGITAGTGPGTYGVDQPLTRGQMAVFLSLALGLHFPN